MKKTVTSNDGAAGIVVTLGPPLIGIKELADWSGIPVSTLYSLLAGGRGPVHFKLGRLLRFRPADVHCWLDGMGREAAA